MTASRSSAPLSALAAKAGAKAFARFGFTEQTLLTRWTDIVGDTLGQMTLPVKISFPRGERSHGVLRVMAESAAALELQHLGPQIVERINSVFGYPAVRDLSIVQGPVARRKARPATPILLDPEAERNLADLIAPVADDGLKRSLARLGRALYARTAR